jgi:hypothetical protein
MAKAAVTPAQQARRDREKSKGNPVKSLADMTPEEREAVIAELSTRDNTVAKRRAEAAKRSKY